MQSFITIIIKRLVPTQTEPNSFFGSLEVFVYKHQCVILDKIIKLLSWGIQKNDNNPATSRNKKRISYWLHNRAGATVACILKRLPSATHMRFLLIPKRRFSWNPWTRGGRYPAESGGGFTWGEQDHGFKHEAEVSSEVGWANDLLDQERG